MGIIPITGYFSYKNEAFRSFTKILKEKLFNKPESDTKKIDPAMAILGPSIKVNHFKGNTKMKKVCVLGLGYIGLPTSIVLAENGFDVTGFDIDETKVAHINNGDPVIEEPEIYEKLQIVLKYGTLKASTTMCKADYFIIAVPTPFRENPSTPNGEFYPEPDEGSDKKSDLSYVYSAAEFISEVLEKGNTILLESTIPVGATKEVAQFIESKTGLKAGKDFYIAHCPERVLPGKIFKELIENDRVIGGINYESSCKASLLYHTFVTGTIHLTDDKTAEMVKLIENSSRDAQVAFAHQIASMAQTQGINPYEVIELANKHPRVNILKPTCGVGGHCIAIDPWFLVESFPHNCDLIKMVRKTNDNRPKEVTTIIRDHIEKWETESLKNCKVLLLGLTYKPDVDDLRESPALQIATQMSSQKNITVLVAEPNIKKQKLISLFPQNATSVDQGIQNADIIVYLVGHKRFKAIDKKLLKNKLILDFCGITYKEKFSNTKTEKNGMLDFFITNYGNTNNCQNNNKENIS